ncbi:PREDICTED: inactive TPR repeat-containing thioredoxin TTL3-like [Lupinus angustifolius]|uniref:inactive TPR repeat-containing thioredoxin TTL3-like n=1 Tax=Lupinus angustifolius TaxID=3871 RepID=UPI00092F3A19|nr:PREDICTED: inactive TPR repeat-containing thioredoxin TTL3-like [Lupinus angustifolius]
MGDISPERRYGCGLISAVFRRRTSWSGKSITSGSSPIRSNNGTDFVKPSNTHDSKRRRGGSDISAASVVTTSSNASKNSSTSYVVTQSPSLSNYPQIPTTTTTATHVVEQRKQQPNETAMAVHGGSSGTRGVSKAAPTQGYVNQGRKVPREAVGISGELESMIVDHQKNKGSNNLVRASSSNVMLYGNLGNLRQSGQNISPHNAKENYYNNIGNVGGYTKNNNNNNINNTMDNNVGYKSKEVVKPSKEQLGSLCRALSTRMDPEQLKIMGNEDYKNGRFAEALALYDAAIAIDPNKASYRSNRSAALTALGRLLEAVFECREAIRIDSHYHRAHHRLGSLYFRLGEVDSALYHYKQAGAEADPDEVAKVKNLQTHLHKCTEARRLGDWNTLITVTNNAISSGADSAPQIFALQAEALLKLRRHENAEKVMSKCRNIDYDEGTKFFGPIGNANFLVTHAKVHLASGRFENALEEANKATRLDSNNKEANKVLKKIRAITSSRAKGNELFKASKFTEACVAYGEGLEHDPYNSLLLCNRAACRSKLGQYEKALEDCNAALNLRPSYTKARLRRADCNAKLKRWEASIQDYEVLVKEAPENEELNKALLEAQAHLLKRQGDS